MPSSSEASFQRAVTEAAQLAGWQTMHVRRTIGKGGRWTTGTSVSGWPDLTFYRPDGNDGLLSYFHAELKSATGRLSDDQRVCIESLRGAGQVVYVWRPADWDAIETVLFAHLHARSGRP